MSSDALPAGLPSGSAGFRTETPPGFSRTAQNSDMQLRESSTPMSSDTFDPTALGELLDLGDEDDRGLVVELIEIFLRDAPARVQALVEAAATRDFGGVERAAHALRGSAGNLGALAVQRLAESLQVAGRLRDRDAATSRAA